MSAALSVETENTRNICNCSRSGCTRPREKKTATATSHRSAGHKTHAAYSGSEGGVPTRGGRHYLLQEDTSPQEIVSLGGGGGGRVSRQRKVTQAHSRQKGQPILRETQLFCVV